MVGVGGSIVMAGMPGPLPTQTFDFRRNETQVSTNLVVIELNHLKESQAAQGDEEKLFVVGPGGQGPEWGPAWFPVLEQGQKVQEFLLLKRSFTGVIFSPTC